MIKKLLLTVALTAVALSIIACGSRKDKNLTVVGFAGDNLTKSAVEEFKVKFPTYNIDNDEVNYVDVTMFNLSEIIDSTVKLKDMKDFCGRQTPFIVAVQTDGENARIIGAETTTYPDWTAPIDVLRTDGVVEFKLDNGNIKANYDTSEFDDSTVYRVASIIKDKSDTIVGILLLENVK